MSEDNILKKASKEDVSYGGHDYSFDKKNEYTSDQMAVSIFIEENKSLLRINTRTYCRC